MLLVVFALMFARGDGAFAVDEVPRPEPAIACPSQDFQEFLEIFAEDEAVQRAFTKTPLIVRYAERRSEPDVIDVMYTRDYDRIKFPVFLQRGNPIMILEVSDRHAEVKIGPDSGYLVYYSFSRDTCWRLVFINDTSM